MGNKLKKICKFVLFFIYSNVIYGLIVYFTFIWLSGYSLMLGYFGNILLIILGLLLDVYLQKFLKSKNLAIQLKDEKNPEKAFRTIKTILDNYISFKTVLYLFYVIILILSQILVFYPSLFGDNISNFIEANSYSILFLIALDMLSKQFTKDRGELREIAENLNNALAKSENKEQQEESTQISMMDILIGTHISLERQGPGSMEMIENALSVLGNLDGIKKIADLGCGTGGQTMDLAKHINGEITGVDQSSDFIDILNENAKKLNLQDRVRGIIASMEDLPFEKESLDLIWSEGAIDSIGFENGLAHWYDFLKKDGYVVVSCPSWLTEEHPEEVESFWVEGGSGIDSIEYNLSVMEKIGYRVLSTFAIPEECWTENYFALREAAEDEFAEKYPGNKVVEEYIKDSRYEVELYSKYKQNYGYVFYIGKKI